MNLKPELPAAVAALGVTDNELEALKPAWRVPDGFVAIPTAALDPPHRAAFPAVPALDGSGFP